MSLLISCDAEAEAVAEAAAAAAGTGECTFSSANKLAIVVAEQKVSPAASCFQTTTMTTSCSNCSMWKVAKEADPSSANSVRLLRPGERIWPIRQ